MKVVIKDMMTEIKLTNRELRTVIRALSLQVRMNTEEAETCFALARNILTERQDKISDLRGSNGNLLETSKLARSRMEAMREGPGPCAVCRKEKCECPSLPYGSCPHQNTVVDGVCTVCMEIVSPSETVEAEACQCDASESCKICEKRS